MNLAAFHAGCGVPWVRRSADDVRRGRRLHLKAMFIAAAVIVTYWGLVVTNMELPLRMACAAVLATGLIAFASSITMPITEPSRSIGG